MRPENHECGERGLSDDIVFHEPGTLENETCPEGAQTSVPDLHERIVRHCAPTLAGLKCGSMFRVNSDPHGILTQVSELEYELSHRGLRLDALVVDEEGCLLYVYRPKLLEARLADPEVRDFLSCYGYAARSCSSHGGRQGIHRERGQVQQVHRMLEGLRGRGGRREEVQLLQEMP